MSDLKTYKQAEIEAPDFVAIVETAKALWSEACAAYVAKNGDTGTCVLGAGIYCMVVPKGKRKPREHKIISALSVTRAQGADVWESCRKPVLAFLRANGISCAYEYGFMD